MESKSLIIHEVRFENESADPCDPIHDALRLPELLKAIFSWLSHANLTRVARACRFWSTLALDVIWEKIPELNHLVGTYSPLVRLSMMPDGSAVWKFKDISRGGRWDAFLAYAGRVRTIEACTGLYTVEVTDHFKHKLQTSSCGPSLLPNLRALSIRVLAYGPHVVEALPIIPAGLRSLRVTTKHYVDSSAIQRLFKHLAGVPLDHLVDVEFDRLGPIFSDASLSLCRTTFLQQNRSTLKHLNLSIFPLTSEDLEDIGSFPDVTKLTLEQRGTSIQLSVFFDVIGSSFPSLRSIGVLLDYRIRDDVSIAEIEGLAPCQGLQSIHLETHRWRALTEEDVAEIGCRWPDLEEFCLFQARYHPDQVTAPLGILQDFAQVWSRTLRKVALVFDTAAPLPGSSSEEEPVFKFDLLETLQVGCSYLLERDIDDAAEFLKLLSLRPLNVVSCYGGNGDSRYHWDVVKDRVNAAWDA